MNTPAPDGSQPGTQRPEGAVLRFLRWLIEPPIESQPKNMRVVRWLLRAGAWVVYAALVGPDDGHGGGGGGARKGGKPGERPS